MANQRHPDWPVIANALAAQVGLDALHPAAMGRAQVKRRGKSARRTPSAGWGVTFSGGADSLALLLILWVLGPGRWGRDFCVLHFNHRLRGRAANADEKFCRDVCARLGVRFVAGRWRDARQGSGEAAARSARFEFFRAEMARRDLGMLWLAHQQDDIAETLLMRLARGSGAGGLAAPRPVQVVGEGRVHLRPLLTLKKAALIAALKRAGAVWREDASNAGGDFFRNRVRHRVLPAWTRAAGRDALAGAALSRELIEEDDTALDAWVDELEPIDRRGRLLIGNLAGKPRAVVRRALHRWLLKAKPATDLSRHGFNRLLAAVEKGGDTRFSLGSTGFAVLSAGRLVYRKG